MKGSIMPCSSAILRIQESGRMDMSRVILPPKQHSDQRENEADDQACHDGKIERAAAPANDDVSRQASDGHSETHKKTRQNEDDARDDQETGQFISAPSRGKNNPARMPRSRGRR